MEKLMDVRTCGGNVIALQSLNLPVMLEIMGQRICDTCGEFYACCSSNHVLWVIIHVQKYIKTR